MAIIFEEFNIVLSPFFSENSTLSFNIGASMKAHGKLYELKSNKGIHEEIIQKCMELVDAVIDKRFSSTKSHFSKEFP
jgi:hypothetical protein